MAQLAIDVLWLLVGIIILAGVVWFAIWVIEQFVHPIPEIVKRGIWVIILILVIIMAIATLVGGSSGMRGPSFLGRRSALDWWDYAAAVGYL